MSIDDSRCLNIWTVQLAAVECPGRCCQRCRPTLHHGVFSSGANLCSEWYHAVLWLESTFRSGALRALDLLPKPARPFARHISLLLAFSITCIHLQRRSNSRQWRSGRRRWPGLLYARRAADSLPAAAGCRLGSSTSAARNDCGPSSTPGGSGQAGGGCRGSSGRQAAPVPVWAAVRRAVCGQGGWRQLPWHAAVLPIRAAAAGCRGEQPAHGRAGSGRAVESCGQSDAWPSSTS